MLTLRQNLEGCQNTECSTTKDDEDSGGSLTKDQRFADETFATGQGSSKTREKSRLPRGVHGCCGKIYGGSLMTVNIPGAINT